jgi:hypothetical protein
MALKFWVGFDNYVGTDVDFTDQFQNPTGVTPAVSHEPAGGARGTDSSYVNINQNSNEITTFRTRAWAPPTSNPMGSLANPINLSWWMRCDGNTAGGFEKIMVIYEGNGDENPAEDGFGIWMNADGTLRFDFFGNSAEPGGTGVSTSSSSVADGQWHHVRIRYAVHDSTGICQMWIDGVLEVNNTSIDTTGAGDNIISTEGIDTWGIGSVDLADIDYDDLIVWDEEDNGDGFNYGNVNVGRLVIEEIVPATEGNSADFTPQGGSNNALMVDEPHESDEDTTYVESSTNAHQDLYGMVDI